MPDLGPGFIFILGTDFTFGTSAADQMTPSEPRRSVPLTCVHDFLCVCVCVSLHLSHPLFIMCRFGFVYTSCLSQTGWKGWKIADFPKEQTVPAGPIKAICSVRPCLSAPPSSGKTQPPAAPPDSSSLPKTYGTCPQSAWPQWTPHRLAIQCANSLRLPETFRSITVRYQRGPSWGSRQKWHFQSASTYYPASAPGLVKLDLWLSCQHK